jgi:hypothetical protein
MVKAIFRVYPVTYRLDYCQFLLVSQINYTLTYFADHAHTIEKGGQTL